MARTQTTNKKAAAAPAQPVQALQPTRMPLSRQLAEEFDINALQWRVLVDQIFPSAQTVEAVMMALEYCKARSLDIFKKPVHIVPMWSSKKQAYVETVWPGVAEIRTTAHRTKQYAGMDPMTYGPERTVAFEGEVKIDGAWKKVSREVTFYEWIDCTVYRMVEHTRVPFTLRTFWEEAYATTGRGELPNDMWCKRPKGQHMKVAEVAVLRMAFPEELGNEYAAEEMEGRTIDLQPQRQLPASAPPTSMQEAKKVAPPVEKSEPGKEEAVDAEVVNEEQHEQTALDQFEAAISKAATVEEITEIWDNAPYWDDMSPEDIDVARQLRKGRIAQLSAAPAEEKNDDQIT
jgi:phage recombination protein Bet